MNLLQLLILEMVSGSARCYEVFSWGRYDDGHRYSWNGLCEKVADRVLFVDGGLILEDNTPERVFDAPTNERTKSFLDKILLD